MIFQFANPRFVSSLQLLHLESFRVFLLLRECLAKDKTNVRKGGGKNQLGLFFGIVDSSGVFEVREEKLVRDGIFTRLSPYKLYGFVTCQHYEAALLLKSECELTSHHSEIDLRVSSQVKSFTCIAGFIRASINKFGGEREHLGGKGSHE